MPSVPAVALHFGHTATTAQSSGDGSLFLLAGGAVVLLGLLGAVAVFSGGTARDATGDTESDRGLTSCPDCGQLVATSSATCPKCEAEIE